MREKSTMNSIVGGEKEKYLPKCNVLGVCGHRNDNGCCKLLTSVYKNGKCKFQIDPVRLEEIQSTMITSSANKKVESDINHEDHDSVENIPSREFAESVLKGHYVTDNEHEETCQFYTIAGCKATSQKSCYRCRFYVPNMLTKTNILAEDVTNAITTLEKTKKKLAKVESNNRRLMQNVISTTKECDSLIKECGSLITELLKNEIIESTHYGEF